MTSDEPGLHLGFLRRDGGGASGGAAKDPLHLPLPALLRHAMALGSSGSGKTVLCKAIVEEVVRAGVPAICVDPQGDLCSLLAEGDAVKLEAHGVDPEAARAFRERADVVIFTPASRRGVPLCADPIDPAVSELPQAERVRALTRTAATLVSLLGYDVDGDEGAGLCAVFDHALSDFVDSGKGLGGLGDFAEQLASLKPKQLERYARYLDVKRIKTALQRLARLDVGARRLLFHEGIAIDPDVLLGRSGPSEPGRTRVSVIYLNTLNNQDDKDFFVAALAGRLYDWMLKHPSKDPQALFYIDEVAPFVPPVRKPACKESLQLLFKQARKYGVCCLMATQNPGDVDYKAMAQFGSWALGRLTTRQDIKKIEPTIKALDPLHSDAIVAELPSLKPGEFVLLSPDWFDETASLNVRWLYGSHETWDEDRIEAEADARWRERFAELERGRAARDADDTAESSLAAPSAVEPSIAEPSAVEPPIAEPSTADEPAPQTLRMHEPEPEQPAPEPEDEPVPPTLPMHQHTASSAHTMLSATVAMPAGPPPAVAPAPQQPAPQQPAPQQPAPVAPAPQPPTPVPSPPLPAASPQPAPLAPTPEPEPEPSIDPELARAEKTLARRNSATAKEFAQLAGVGETKARGQLKRLVKAGLARSYKDGRSQRYYAPASGARPDLGLGREVAVARALIDEAAATRKAREAARTKWFGVIGDDERFERAELWHRAVYRVQFEEQVDGPLMRRLLGSGKDTRVGSVYLNTATLEPLVLGERGLRFTSEPGEHASDLRDLDGVAVLERAAPASLRIDEQRWRAGKGEKAAREAFRKRWAATPGSISVLFVPIWRLILARSDGTSSRVLLLDGVVGKPVEWA